MEGLLKEGEESIEAKLPETLRDLALTVGARKVEHYEMASYCSAGKLATALDLKEVASLLTESFDEEEAADAKMIEICARLAHQHTPRESDGGQRDLAAHAAM
jgi:ferritin-like metal-binding protein YciE